MDDHCRQTACRISGARLIQARRTRPRLVGDASVTHRLSPAAGPSKSLLCFVVAFDPGPLWRLITTVAPRYSELQVAASLPSPGKLGRESSRSVAVATLRSPTVPFCRT